MKLAFLLSEVLLCLYDKQNNTWLLVNMGFLFSCSTRHLTSSLRSLVSYRVKHSKRNSTPKSGARIFFSRTSQGHNALPRPGLEPRSSDSEPSALTTGLLDKAVALACPRYSWARVFKVAPCTVVRSYIRIFSAWWVTTILYNYGATFCELRYYSLCIMPGKFVSCTLCNKLVLLSHYYIIHWKHFLTLNEKSLTLSFSADGRFESNREQLKIFFFS